MEAAQISVLPPNFKVLMLIVLKMRICRVHIGFERVIIV